MIYSKMTLNVALENRLAAFIAKLAISPQNLDDYREDPEAAMEVAGLSDQDKDVLRSGDWQGICELLGSEDTRPLRVGSRG